MKMQPGPAPTLHELQRWMAAVIVGDRPFSTLAESDACADWIDVRNGNAAERLSIYVNGYPVRIEEALEEQFPAVAHIVGATAFAALARRYAATTPLRSYNLNHAGTELPQFLADDPLSARLPFLPDLARLEVEVARAFHAVTEPALDVTPLAAWTADRWEQARLRFQPWVAVVASAWPIRELWECRETPIEEIDLAIDNCPDCVIVRRAGDAVMCDSLEPGEEVALTALLDGQTLGQVVATLALRGEDPARVGKWFTRWVELGAVVSCAADC